MKKNTDFNFEIAIQQIEDIIQKFETEVINLNESIELYKQGQTLIKSCQNKLSSIEQQIQIFNQETNSLENFIDK